MNYRSLRDKLGTMEVGVLLKYKRTQTEMWRLRLHWRCMRVFVCAKSPVTVNPQTSHTVFLERSALVSDCLFVCLNVNEVGAQPLFTGWNRRSRSLTSLEGHATLCMCEWGMWVHVCIFVCNCAFQNVCACWSQEGEKRGTHCSYWTWPAGLINVAQRVTEWESRLITLEKERGEGERERMEGKTL